MCEVINYTFKKGQHNKKKGSDIQWISQQQTSRYKGTYKEEEGASTYNLASCTIQRQCDKILFISYKNIQPLHTTYLKFRSIINEYTRAINGLLTSN